MVKCNGYGHGMTQVAHAALEAGAIGLGVATVDEALNLRETEGFELAPIVTLAPTTVGDVPYLQAAHIAVSVGSVDLLKAHLVHARKLGRPARLHVQVDTGLGRDGIRFDDFRFLNDLATTSAAASAEGIFTHFAVSDSAQLPDAEFTNEQRERFERAMRAAFRAGLKPICHAANSGAVLRHAQTHFDAVRPGILLYGATPGGATAVKLDLRPALTFKAALVSIKEMEEGDTISYGRLFKVPTRRRIGIVSAGYGDGYKLGFTNKGEVLIRGTRCPVRGRICMDQFMVDLSEVPDAQLGDEVVLYGRQGEARISLEEAAQVAGTIPYDLTCSLGTRIPRYYVG